MKVLILSITAGGGHNSAASALKEYFVSAGAQCETLDTFGYISPTIANSINKGYLWMSGKAGKAFGFGYHTLEKRNPPLFADMTPAQITGLPLAKEILSYISVYSPDVILFTHCFAGIILHLLKKEGKITVPTVGILTVFVFHPYWEDCTANDYVVIPSPDLRFQGFRKGFTESQLLPLGIPVSPRFAESMPKKDARALLGLDPDAATVLLMGGSMGYGNMGNILAQLDTAAGDSLQIIAVCGNNAKAKADLEAMDTRCSLLPLGFVDYVDQLMDAADCIVTKPGGLTTSEALAKRLPMVIVNPIPGQEARNTQFLLNSGTAVATYDMCTADELVIRLMDEPRRLEAMRLSIEELRHPTSTQDVCEFVIQLCEGRT